MFGLKKARRKKRRDTDASAQQQTTMFEKNEEELEVVYVDENGNLVDEQGNLVEDDGDVVYVDEDGNELQVETYVEYVYVDEDGNPVEGDVEDEVVYVDEKGNYVDAKGNPVNFVEAEDDEVEIVYVDEEGNEIDFDETGRPIDREPNEDDEDKEDEDAAAGEEDAESEEDAENEDGDDDVPDDTEEYMASRAKIQEDFKKSAHTLELEHNAGVLSAADYAARLKELGEECDRQVQELDDQFDFIEVEVDVPATPKKKKTQMQETADDLKFVVRESAQTLRSIKGTVDEFKELTDFKSWLK